MRVLVFEDDDKKYESLKAGLVDIGVDRIGVVRARSLAAGLRELMYSFDLYVVDLWLPMVDCGDPVDVTGDVVALIEQKSRSRTPIIVITSFAAEAGQHASFLASKGVHIYDFFVQDVWKKAVAVFVLQARDRHRYDFLIFTALDEERRAYSHIEGFNARSVSRANLDFWDFEWEGARGAVVLFPRMGLITAAVATTRVLENYSPKFICMSGICGGIGKETHLGQLLITELCWEYQSGKWTDDFFTAEPYQVEISESLKLSLSKFIEGDRVGRQLEAGFEHGLRPAKVHGPKLAIFATGSAVIASEERLTQVREQHRKVAGIDMEVYGFHRAARMCDDKIVAFSAKCVVDKADVQKSDDLHAYGCFVSARFCLSYLSYALSDAGRSQ